jgi:hypothetical protein
LNIIDRILRYLGYGRLVDRVIDIRGVQVTSDHLSHNLKFASKAYAPPTQYVDIEGCKPEDEVPLSDEEVARTKKISP